MTTRRAGRLIPAARVGVAAMDLSSPALKASSTARRWTFVSPAWWKALPVATKSARRPPREVGSSCRPRTRAERSRRDVRSSSLSRDWMRRESRRASTSAERRVFTKVRACPPPSTTSATREPTASPSGSISRLVLSVKSTRPSR